MLTGLAAVVVVWVGYKASTIRSVSRSVVDTGCESDSNTVAELGQLAFRAPPIRCLSWDIGTGVAGYVWNAASPRAALLLEHGWGDYCQRYVKQFSQLIPHLLAHGISVYAVDMWGNGRSPGSRGATDIAAAVDDHLAARRRLSEQPLPVFVLGHSVGGLVTATSVLRDPSGVRGMILIAPALRWDVSGPLRTVARVGGFLVPTFAMPVPPADPATQSRDAQLHERMVRDPLMHRGSISWVTAGSGAAISHANWPVYSRITAPVLVVHGTGDVVAIPAASRAFIDSVRSEDKMLNLVDGGRHSLLDDPPSNEEALRIIMDWLQDRLPRLPVAHRPRSRAARDVARR
jgi:alpha-beta hydrolase superfamily lysophospholipase